MSRRSHVLPTLAVAGALAVGSALAPRTASAQRPRPTYDRDLPKALLHEARITEDSAAKVAMARIPNGRIRAVELEREHGKLIYSYELKVPHRSGVEEVNVNAIDGSVVNVEHEGGEGEGPEGGN